MMDWIFQESHRLLTTSSASADAEPFLIVGFAVLMIITLVINVYILAYWQHPEDKGESIMSKFLIVFGLQLSAVSVLMLPIDFANNAGNPSCDSNSILNDGTSQFCGGIQFFSLWQAFCVMICFTVIVFIPFAIFYYEEDAVDLNDGTPKKFRWVAPLCYDSVFLFAFLILLLALYYTRNAAELTIQQVTYPVNQTEVYTYTRTPGDSPYSFLDLTLPADFEQAANTTAKDSIITMPVSFPVYLIGLFGWCGWWLFALFTGTGLVAAPLDNIMAFVQRPRLLPPDVLANIELELQERTGEIIEITHLLKRERAALNDGGREGKRSLRQRYVNDRLEVNRLTQMVFCLENEVEDYKACKHIRNDYNPLLAPAQLASGCLFAMLSLLWALQIILAVLSDPPVTPFLSVYLLSFDSWFPMFGNLTYALFSLYLLFCTIQGCFKLSVRAICIKIHPMKIHCTYLNAFLFNLGIVMLCTIPLINFCTLAFASYAVDTDAFFLFIVQANNLKFFKIFYEYHVFPWIILLTACLCLPYFLYRPKDVPVTPDEFRRNMMNRANGGGASGSMYSPIGFMGNHLRSLGGGNSHNNDGLEMNRK